MASSSPRLGAGIRPVVRNPQRPNRIHATGGRRWGLRGDEIAHVVSPRAVGGARVAAMLPTLVELDAGGAPVGAAITWEDARPSSRPPTFATKSAPRCCTASPASGSTAATWRRCTPGYAARPCRRHGGRGQGRAVPSADGRLLTDPSTAAGSASSTWARRVEMPKWSWLPAFRVYPRSRPPAPRCRWRGRGGSGGAYRRAAGGARGRRLGARRLGVGATRHGDVAVIAGTSAIVLGICDGTDPRPGTALPGHPAHWDGWGLEMDLLAMGSAFERYRRPVRPGRPGCATGGGGRRRRRRRTAVPAVSDARASRARCGIRP